ncbi:hypothetical protein V2G26_012979 [Clonostachys chloroleuca]
MVLCQAWRIQQPRIIYGSVLLRDVRVRAAHHSKITVFERMQCRDWQAAAPSELFGDAGIIKLSHKWESFRGSLRQPATWHLIRPRSWPMPEPSCFLILTTSTGYNRAIPARQWKKSFLFRRPSALFPFLSF